MVAAAPDGTLALGSIFQHSALEDDGNSIFEMGRHLHGATGALTTVVQMIPCGFINDKPFMAWGSMPPGPGNAPTSDVAYVGWSRSRPLMTARSLSFTHATAWPLNGEPDSPTVVRCNPDPNTGIAPPETGHGVFPVVLGGSSSKPGRLILGSSQHGAHIDLPEFTASDVGGGGTQSDWGVPVAAIRLLNVYNGSQILGTGDSDIQGVTHVPLPAGTDARTWPSIALDPRNNNTLLVAHAGRLTTDTQHLALFIAESIDAGGAVPGGLTFPDGPPPTPQQRWVLTGDLLRMPGETENWSVWMPSITIDGCRGVSLVFLRTTDIGECSSCNPPRVKVRYAWWPSITALATPPHAPSYVADLSPEFYMWAPGTGYDYIMVTSSGGEIYPAWAQQTNPGQWDVFVAHVVTCR
jgi:hypothetical protein